MKITKKHYDDAKAKIPKLKKAEEIVKEWEKGVASMGETDMEILAVEITPFGPAVTCKPKEKTGAQGAPSRGAA